MGLEDRLHLVAVMFKMAAVEAKFAALINTIIAERRYNPNWSSQPRVPAGNPDGGQWTTGAGSSGSADDERVRVAQTVRNPGFYSINLEAEELRGGHAVARHVGKTPEWLRASLGATYRIIGRSGGMTLVELRHAWGSFRSIEDANDLVSRALRAHPFQVEQVVSGELEQATINLRIGSPTGLEAYWPSLEPPPEIRRTFAVRVIIRHSAAAARGYRVMTAFPFNEDSPRIRIE